MNGFKSNLYVPIGAACFALALLSSCSRSEGITENGTANEAPEETQGAAAETSELLRDRVDDLEEQWTRLKAELSNDNEIEEQLNVWSEDIEHGFDDIKTKLTDMKNAAGSQMQDLKREASTRVDQLERKINDLRAQHASRNSRAGNE